MKNILMILLSMNMIFACSFNEDDSSESDAQLKELLDKGVKNLKNRTNNFNVHEGSYITIEKDTSQRSKLHNIPVNFFSAVEMNINDVLQMLEAHYGFTSYMPDFHSLDEASKENVANIAKNLTFKGSMKDFLSYLGSVYGVHLTLSDNKMLKVKYYLTKTYSIDQFLDSHTSSASISIGGTEGTSGGLSGTSQSSVQTTTWSKISTYLTQAIGTNGRATILEDFSIVTITARPWVFKEIDDLFEKLKKETQMQVAVQYRIISLSKTKLDQLAVQFGINKSTSDGYTIVSDLVSAIALSQIGGGLSVNDSSVSSRLDALVSSLSQDVISKGQFVGLPNRIMPINLTTSQAYVEEITRETDETTGDVLQEVSPGEIVTGLSILILPKVLDDGRIQLTSGFTEKRLRELELFSGVQLPTVDETETLSTVTIDSGSIELIALYSENDSTDNKAIQLFAAGDETKTENRIIAVLIGADSYKLSSSVSKRG